MVINLISVKEGNGHIIEKWLKDKGYSGIYRTKEGMDIFPLITDEIFVDEVRKFSQDNVDLVIDFLYKFKGLTVDTQFQGGLDLNEQLAFFAHESYFM